MPVNWCSMLIPCKANNDGVSYILYSFAVNSFLFQRCFFFLNSENLLTLKKRIRTRNADRMECIMCMETRPPARNKNNRYGHAKKPRVSKWKEMVLFWFMCVIHAGWCVCMYVRLAVYWLRKIRVPRHCFAKHSQQKKKYIHLSYVIQNISILIYISIPNTELGIKKSQCKNPNMKTTIHH